MVNEYDDRILEWFYINGLKNSSGEKFEWQDHEFLIDPLCDWHPRQGMNKGAQLGASETIGVGKSMFAPKELGLNVIYTLPSDKFLERFVPPKVNEIIKVNPVLSDVTGNISIKQVPYKNSRRFIYYLGTYSSKSSSEIEASDKGVSITGDLLINDEASRSNQFILSQLRSRLDNSDYAGIWDFDNPSYPSVGSDAIYRNSDQRHWMIRCPRCYYKQYLDWKRLDEHTFESGSNHCWIDTEKLVYRCGRCLGVIPDEARRQGEWVAKFPDITTMRGYWMPQLIYVKHTVAKILAKENDPRLPKSQFYNYTLARPYLGSEISITRENILSNLTKGHYTYKGMALGVDQGKIKTWVLGNKDGIIDVGRTESWDEIEKLIQKYQPVTVIDNLPYPHHPTLLAKKYPGLVYRAIFRNESDQSELATFFSNKNDPNKVLIKREQMFEVIVSTILSNNSPIYADLGKLEDFIKEWQKLVRSIEEDKRGNERSVWIKAEEPCDFPFAHLYYYTALMTSGNDAIIGSMATQAPELPIAPDISGGSLSKDFIKEFTADNNSGNIV